MGNVCPHSQKVCDSDTDENKCDVSLPLTNNEIVLLKESWSDVEADWESIIHTSYERAFSQHPEIRRVFISSEEEETIRSISESISIQKHSKRFKRFIGEIINNITDHKEIAKKLHALGKKHCQYGAEQRFVTAVTTNLKFAICERICNVSSDIPNYQTQNAWDSLLRFLGGMLKGGLREMEQKNIIRKQCVNEFKKLFKTRR